MEHTNMALAKFKRTSQQASQKNSLRRLGAISQNQPNSTKKPRTIVPPPQSARIMQRYVGGDSIRQIARAEKRDRATVTKIIRSDEMNAFVQEMRERYYGLAPDALATIEYALQEQKDARIGLEVLRDIGVRPQKGESVQLPATTPEDGFTRQAVIVANVMLEAHQNMGVPLPEGVEEALAKDARECAEAAKTSGAKLPRVSGFSGNGSRRSRTVSSRN
jgi:hypothetical protein